MRSASRSASDNRGSSVALVKSPTTTQSRSPKAIAGSGRTSTQVSTTNPASNAVSATKAAGRRHSGKARQALGDLAGMRSGARPGIPTSNTSCTVGRPLKYQRPCDFHCSCAPRSPSSCWPPRSNDSATADTRIWLGRANAIRRAAVGLATPSTSNGLAPAATAASLFCQAST